MFISVCQTLKMVFLIQIMIHEDLGRPTHFKLGERGRISYMKLRIQRQELNIDLILDVAGKMTMKHLIVC